MGQNYRYQNRPVSVNSSSKFHIEDYKLVVRIVNQKYRMELSVVKNVNSVLLASSYITCLMELEMFQVFCIALSHFKICK